MHNMLSVAPNPTRDPQLLKGVLPMLALALLAERESYGYELVTRLRAAGLDPMAPGTVYPVLNRLERDGYLESFLVPSPSGPARKYYRPTPRGQQEFQQSYRAWTAMAELVESIVPGEEQE